MNRALVISAQDNVATALEPLDAGEILHVGGSTIAVAEPIPRGHKVALRAIGTGEIVVKYGSPIGTASADIFQAADAIRISIRRARASRVDARRDAHPPRIRRACRQDSIVAS